MTTKNNIDQFTDKTSSNRTDNQPWTAAALPGLIQGWPGLSTMNGDSNLPFVLIVASEKNSEKVPTPEEQAKKVEGLYKQLMSTLGDVAKAEGSEQIKSALKSLIELQKELKAELRLADKLGNFDGLSKTLNELNKNSGITVNQEQNGDFSIRFYKGNGQRGDKEYVMTVNGNDGKVKSGERRTIGSFDGSFTPIETADVRNALLERLVKKN